MSKKDNIVTIDYVSQSGGKGKYTGPVKDGLPEGEGVITFDNGTSYKGTFKNGVENGHGVCY